MLAFSLLAPAADALTFGTSRSGDHQTVTPNQEFTIRFSVNLKGATAIKNSDNQLVDDSNANPDQARTIDSSGYLVTYIGNTAYRNLPSGTTPSGTLVIDPRPTYNDETPNQAGSPNATYYVDTSRNVVDADGKAVYVQTGTGARRDDSDPQNITPADPWKYTRAKADPTTKLSDGERYHYNEEAIGINVQPGTLTFKRGNTVIPSSISTQLSGDPTNATASLYEGADDTNRRLSSPITLTGTATAAGVYTITITDITEDSDFPTAPSTAASITLTVYVVTPAHSLSSPSTNFATNEDGVYYGYKGDDRQISSNFTFTPANAPVYYSVQGSGQLYVGTANRNLRLPNGTLTSSSAPVFLRGHTGTSKITAYVASPNPTPRTAIYLYIDTSNLTKIPRITITGGNDQTGATEARLEEPLKVRVTDGNNHPVSGVAVGFTATNPTGATTASKFIPVPDTTVYGSGSLLTQAISNLTFVNNTTDTTTATALKPSANEKIYVQTDRNGEAEVYYQLSSSTGDHGVTATLQGANVVSINTKFAPTAVDTGRSASLVIVSGNNQRSDANTHDVKDPLVIRVRRPGGYRISGVRIRFTVLTGVLYPGPGRSVINGPGQNNPTLSGQEIFLDTDAHGEAAVTYNAGQITGAKTVTARVDDEEANSQYDFQIRQVVFNINGTTTTTPPATTQPTTPSLSISTTGEGATRSVTVSTSDGQAIGVTLDGTALTASQVVTAGTATTITLPTTPGTYTLTATAPGYTAALATSVTVAAAATPGTLSLATLGAAVNGQQTIQVTVRTSANTAPSGTVTVTLSGAGVSGTVETSNGSGRAIIALPTTAGTLTASATGYTSGTLALPARTTATTTTPTTPTTPTTGGEPSRISVSGLATHSGTVSQELDLPLSVRVLDANGTGVEDARVVFRVRTGQGRLSQRGNGRAVAVSTDSNGYARAAYTPMSARSTVEGSVTGVTRTVTFTITATGSVPATPTPGGTTGTTAIDPKILVGAANRPAMVWVDNGMLYALTGGEATKIAENVNDAAIGGGKVYWTEKTGASAGTINSANLDGDTGATKLATIMAVPMGIAVDTANSKLYWTNSRGRVQSASLNGSSIRNVQQNLSSPSDIALGNGHIYWTEDGSSIRRVNMTGTKVVKDVAVGLMDVGGIAVGGGKVYWTEKTGASAGTINSANADGTQFKTLATIMAVPMGIAVDTTGKKLYWTNSRGRVQSGNLSAGKITNVVDGLGTPSHLAIGGASQGTTAAKPATQPATQPPKKDTTAYDVNGDGTVDNTDASLVSEAMGTDNKKYDVNGDGTVNFFDLMLVFDNRDAEAAGAPTIVGIQLSSAQIAVIEEQIDLLIATGDRSPAAMRTLVYLQQLIATARPEKTQLLANYPNPFNPETWIPYELATDTDVRITIYNAQGVVIRTLQFGQQSAGYYTDRERAAYWDGRNAQGEQVASGIYFYQLETDEMSSLRKMVILK